MPTPRQVFWSVAITLGVMIALKHVVPRIPVVRDVVAKAL